MPRIRQIPKRLLIHTVKYEKFLGRDEWEETDQYDEPIELERVRVQYASELTRTNNADNVFYKAMMFYDVKNSKPYDVEFVENSRVTINDDTMFIKEVQPVYGFRLHHYELVLI